MSLGQTDPLPRDHEAGLKAGATAITGRREAGRHRDHGPAWKAFATAITRPA